MAKFSNLTIDQGSPFTATITVTDFDGNIQNLTNFTYGGRIKKSYESLTSTAFATPDTLSSNGQLTVTLADTVTKGLSPGIYVYDIEITDTAASGAPTTRVVEGQIEVTPGVKLGAS